MNKIGITGGIGSGKSTVCAIFEILGVPVYYADQEAKTIINSNESLKTQIQALLGKEAYQGDIYNVKFVSKKVFGNEVLLKALNKLVHPLVAEHFENWLVDYKDLPYILKEAAIMKKDKSLDHIINIYASEETRILRILKRDKDRSRLAIESIMANQYSEAEFRELSDFVINNENELLIPQVLAIHQALSK